MNPGSAAVYAQYSVRMNTSAGDAATLESAFSSAVQSGLVQQALQTALSSSSVTVLSADPVQAQRLAVAVALGLSTTPVAPREEPATQCASAEKMEKEWRGCEK